MESLRIQNFLEWHSVAVMAQLSLFLVSWFFGIIFKKLLPSNGSGSLSKSLFMNLFSGFIVLTLIIALLSTSGATIYSLLFVIVSLYLVFFKPTILWRIDLTRELMSLKKYGLPFIIIAIIAQVYFGFLIYSPFSNQIGFFDNDYAYYATLGNYIVESGNETIFLNPEIKSLFPYNYTIPYLAGGIAKLFHVPTIVAFLLIAMPYLFGIVYIGALSILDGIKLRKWNWLAAILIFISAGIGWGGENIFLSNTALSILASPKTSIILLFLMAFYHHKREGSVLLYACLISAFYTTSAVPFFIFGFLVYAVDWNNGNIKPIKKLSIGFFYLLLITLFFSLFYYKNFNSHEFESLDKQRILFSFPEGKELMVTSWRFIRVFIELAIPLFIIYRSKRFGTRYLSKILVIVAVTFILTLGVVQFMKFASHDAIQVYMNFVQGFEILIVFLASKLLIEQTLKYKWVIGFLFFLPMIIRTTVEQGLYDTWDSGMTLESFNHLSENLLEDDQIVFWDESESIYTEQNPYLGHPFKELLLIREYLPNKVSLSSDGQNSFVFNSIPLLQYGKNSFSVDEQLVLDYIRDNKINKIMVAGSQELPCYFDSIIKEVIEIEGHGSIVYLSN